MLKKIISRCNAILSGTSGTIWFLVAVCGMMNIHFLLGPYAPVRVHDTFDSIVPRSVTASILSYWIPEAGCGMDAALNQIPQRLPALMYASLPPWLAYALICLANHILLSVGTFLVARKTFRLDLPAAALAGVVALAAGHEYLNQFSFAIGLFPFLLLGLERLKGERASVAVIVMTALAGLLFAMSATMALFAPFAGAATLAWFILFPPDNNRLRFWGLFFIFWGVVVVANADTLLAFIKLTPLSHRAEFSAIELGAPISEQIVSLLWANIPLLLAFVLIWIFTRKATMHAALGKVVVLFGLLGILGPATGIVLKHPDYSVGIQFERLFFTKYAIIGLMFAIAFGTLSSKVKEASRPGLNVTALMAAILTCAALFLTNTGRAAVSFSTIDTIGRNVAETVHANEAAKGRTPATAAGLFRVGWQPPHPSYAHLQKLETVGGYINSYSLRFKHFWERVITPPGEAVPPYFKYWGNRVYLFGFNNACNLNLLSLANTRYIISDAPVQSDGLVMLQEGRAGKGPDMSASAGFAGRLMARLQYYAGRLTSSTPPFYYYIYENTNVMDRFFVPGKSRAFSDQEALFAQLAQSSLREIRNTLFMEEADGPVSVTHTRAEVRLESYGDDEIELAVDIDGDGVLVVTNQYSPYWKAFVDGVETAVIPAYGTFQGVQLHRGSHAVRLVYSPPWRF